MLKVYSRISVHTIVTNWNLNVALYKSYYPSKIVISYINEKSISHFPMIEMLTSLDFHPRDSLPRDRRTDRWTDRRPHKHTYRLWPYLKMKILKFEIGNPFIFQMHKLALFYNTNTAHLSLGGLPQVGLSCDPCEAPRSIVRDAFEPRLQKRKTTIFFYALSSYVVWITSETSMV